MDTDTFIRKSLVLLRLKELPREGFIQYGMKRSDTDTIASHSYSVILISYLLSQYLKENKVEVDTGKVLEFALLHDTGEAVTGDFGVSVKRILGKENFEKLEQGAIEWLYSDLSFSNEIQEVMKEYEERSSLESIIVKCADHIDAVLQMWVTPSMEFENGMKWHIGESVLSKMEHPKCKTLLRDFYSNFIETCQKSKPSEFNDFVRVQNS